MEQRTYTRICVVKGMSDGMKECEEDGIRGFEGKEKQFVFNSLFNRKPVKSVKNGSYMIRLRSSTERDHVRFTWYLR